MITRDDILTELKGLTAVADQFSTRTPYEAPEGYFNCLAENMLLRIKAETAGSVTKEMEILSPLLGKLDRKTPFTIPEGYFNTFTVDRSQVDGANEAKVIRGSFGKKMVRYSVAAAVAGIIAAGAWLGIKTPVTQQTQLAAGTTQEVIEKVQNMTDNEMKAFLEGGSTMAVYQNTPALAELKTEDVKLMLADVSDEELQHYAEQGDAVMQILN